MNSNKIILSALSLSVITPAIFVPLETSAMTYNSTFKDVSEDFVYSDIVMKMTDLKILSGFEDGTFRPNQPISRKHAATLIKRVTDLPIKENEITIPKDLSAENPYYKDIKTLLNAGLLDIDSKGNVNPNQPLTRGEMAKILTVAFNLKGASHTFTDVSTEYDKYVSALYENNITTGYIDGTFKENEPLSRVHYAVFMYRAMNVQETKDWNLITDEDILSMSNEDIAKYLLPYKYKEGGYLPKGISDVEKHYEQNLKKFNTLRVQLSTRLYMENNMSKDILHLESEMYLSKFIKGWSENAFGLSPKETIELYNRVFTEGIVLSSFDIDTAKAPFVIFYDYQNGIMMTAR